MCSYFLTLHSNSYQHLSQLAVAVRNRYSESLTSGIKTEFFILIEAILIDIATSKNARTDFILVPQHDTHNPKYPNSDETTKKGNTTTTNKNPPIIGVKASPWNNHVAAVSMSTITNSKLFYGNNL